jgi:hypothetical protein
VNFFKTYTIPERVKEQLEAINLLIAQGYTVLDLEGEIIDKNILKDKLNESNRQNNSN